MWFDRYKIEAIDQALKSGQRAGLLSILPEEASVHRNPSAPTFCPKCGKPFVRKNLPYIPANVPSCPEGHGYWLDDDVIRRLRLLIKGGAVVPQRVYKQRASFQVFMFLLGVALVAFNAAQRWDRKEPRNAKMNASMSHSEKVSPSYWPSRDFSRWNAMPSDQNVIVDPEELAYFQKWMVIANEGIVNRLNMHDALLVGRPAIEYVEAYEYYADRQRLMLTRLNALVPPPTLEVFHDHVVAALGSQIDFYDDFVRRKTENPSVELREYLEHPKLVDCDKKLWAAFYEFARIYPSRDAATNNAIEQRLCWLDLI